MSSLHAINTNTLGISEYSGPTFLALAEFNGKLYGITATQLLEVGSGTDEVLECEIQTGFEDFGIDNKKYIRNIVPTHESSDGFTLTLTAVVEGEEVSDSYVFGAAEGGAPRRDPERTQDHIREQHWQLQITNTDGGSIDLISLWAGVQDVKRTF
jgi:hypothetical protein